jgi:predicted SAM-dependent methyltransferase
MNLKKLVLFLKKATFLPLRKTNNDSKTSFLKPKSELLNLGCGLTYNIHWDNYDLFPSSDSVSEIDLLKPFPFESETYSYCYCSHVIEHLHRSYVTSFLSEIFRIMRRGGIFRVVVPDLEGIVRKYLLELEKAAAGDESAIPRHEWMTIELLDQMTRSFSGGFMGRLWYSRPLKPRDLIEARVGSEASQWLCKFDQDFLEGSIPLSPDQVFNVATPTTQEEVIYRNSGEIHRWMYDRVSLSSLLAAAGFQHISVCRAEESRIPVFDSYHLDRDQSGRVRKPDSLFIEAIK